MNERVDRIFAAAPSGVLSSPYVLIAVQQGNFARAQSFTSHYSVIIFQLENVSSNFHKLGPGSLLLEACAVAVDWASGEILTSVRLS
jgi:hypothetical protein